MLTQSSQIKPSRTRVLCSFDNILKSPKNCEAGSFWTEMVPLQMFCRHFCSTRSCSPSGSGCSSESHWCETKMQYESTPRGYNKPWACNSSCFGSGSSICRKSETFKTHMMMKGSISWWTMCVAQHPMAAIDQSINRKSHEMTTVHTTMGETMQSDIYNWNQTWRNHTYHTFLLCCGSLALTAVVLKGILHLWKSRNSLLMSTARPRCLGHAWQLPACICLYQSLFFPHVALLGADLSTCGWDRKAAGISHAKTQVRIKCLNGGSDL